MIYVNLARFKIIPIFWGGFLKVLCWLGLHNYEVTHEAVCNWLDGNDHLVFTCIRCDKQVKRDSP